MSIIYNGTTVPAGGTIRFNGTTLNKVMFNGVKVWERYIGCTLTITKGIYQTNASYPEYGIFPDYSYEMTQPPANGIIRWNRAGEIVANAACSVTFSGRIVAREVDGQSYYVCIYLFKNDSLYHTYLDTTHSGSYYDAILPAISARLATGDRLSVRVWGRNKGSSRTRYEAWDTPYCNFQAVPV